MNKFLLVAMLVAPLAVIGADEAKGKKKGEKLSLIHI